MSFQPVREHHVSAFNLTLREFVDPKSGLRHLHLESPDTNRAFAVAFPTPTDNSDGRPHILEHMALCGSERYPVRDPFMAMTQRSLASFMNAMTFGDRTVYPFSSPDEKDYLNLMDIYLDATFFPKLSRQDFLQEGWRLAVDENQRLTYKGVVFNEMKGALAGRDGTAYRGLKHLLHPGTPYAVESGGDPVDITSLRYESLVAFHREHYHPSQAVVFSYGAIAPEIIHHKLEDILQRHPDLTRRAAPPVALSTLSEPLEVDFPIPVGEQEDSAHTLAMGWLLGPTERNQEGLIATFMAEALLQGDASPMGQALSQQPFGRPGRLSMAMTDERETAFVVSMDGLEATQVADAEQLILRILEDVARDGVPQEHLEATMRSLEMSFRDIGNQTPTGIELILNMVPAALRGTDPVATFDPAQLDALSERLTQPAFVAQWVKTKLLDNPRRITMRQTPDPQWLARREESLNLQLAHTEASLTPGDLEALRMENEELDQEQKKPKNLQCLPCVDIRTVERRPRPLLPYSLEAGTPDRVMHLHVEAGTGGIARVQVHIDLSSLKEEDFAYTHMALLLMDQMGLGGMNWVEAMQWRNQRATGFSSEPIFSSTALSPDALIHRGVMEASSLDRECAQLVPALARTLLEADFSDAERLTFLIEQEVKQIKSQLTHLGGRWASLEGTQHMTSRTRMLFEESGRPMLARMEALQKAMASDPQHTIDQLQSAHRHLLTLPRLVISTGSEHAQRSGKDLAQAIALSGTSFTTLSQARVCPPSTGDTVSCVLTGPTPIQFCYQSWTGPRQTDADHPLLTVLAKAAAHGFLLPAVREQGSAYGTSADVGDGVIQMSSYRDPRLMDTFSDFDRAAHWMMTHPLTEEELQQAKLAVIQKLLMPLSPANQASSTASVLVSGTTEAQRQKYLERVLDATTADLLRVAQTWLKDTPFSRAAFASEEKAQEAPAMESIALGALRTTKRPAFLA